MHCKRTLPGLPPRSGKCRCKVTDRSHFWVWTLARLATGAMLLALGSVVRADCTVTLTRLAAKDGLDYQLDIHSTGLAFAGLSIDEAGANVTLILDGFFGHWTSNMPPERYAREQIVAPIWGSMRLHASVHSVVEPLTKPPQATALCLAWDDPDIFPVLVSQSMAIAFNAAGTVSSKPVRDALTTSASNAATLLLGLVPQTPRTAELAAGAQHVLGALQSWQGRHMDALATYAQAEVRWRAVGREGAAWAAHIHQASELADQGHSEQALEQLQPLLGSWGDAHYPAIAAWAHNDECRILLNLKRLKESDRCFAQLIPRLRQLGEPEGLATGTCNWAITVRALRDWDRASSVLESCLELRQRVGQQLGIAQAHYLLGNFKLRRGDVEGALRHLEAALVSAEMAGDSSAMWETQRALAEARLSADEVPKARDALLRHPADPDQEPQRYERWRWALGRVDLYVGDLDSARENLRHAAAGLEKLGMRTAAAAARCDLALVDPEIAVDPFCDAVSATQIFLKRNDWSQASIALTRVVASAEDRVVHDALRLVVDAYLHGHADVARAQGVLEQARALPTPNRSAEIARLQVFARLAFEFAQLADARGDDALAHLALNALMESRQVSVPIGHGRDARIEELAVPARHRTMAHSSTPPRAGEITVSWTSMLGTTYLVVGAPQGPVVLRRLDTHALTVAVHTWRDAIEHDQYPVAAGQVLARLLDIDTWWPADTRRVIVAAQGELYPLPWSALPIPGPPLARLGYHPLVADASVTYAVNARAASAGPDDFAQRVGIVARRQPGYLPGLDREMTMLRAAAIQAHWSVFDAERPPGSDAGRIAILHVASHATADAIDPERNALRRSPEPEAQPLPLPDAWASRAFLVVLAACQTADGPASGVHGAQSLAQRALDDGAHVVLAHLWSIGDLSASRLHERFYGAIFDGREPAEALALAQRDRMASREDASVRSWASALILERPRPAAAPHRASSVTGDAVLGVRRSEWSLGGTLTHR